MATQDQFVDPSRTLFEAFKALPRDEPVLMLNLLRFKAKATYPSDHALASEGLSGAQAYGHYGTDSGPIFKRVGGEIVFRGDFRTMVIGPEDEHWDAMFVARYPTASAFLEMVTDPDYRVAVVHRQSAVETSRLIRMAESGLGGTFS